MKLKVETRKNGKEIITYHKIDTKDELYYFKRWFFRLKTFDKRIIIW